MSGMNFMAWSRKLREGRRKRRVREFCRVPPPARLARVAVLTTFCTLAVLVVIYALVARLPRSELIIACDVLAVAAGFAIWRRFFSNSGTRTVGAEVGPEWIRVVEVARRGSGISVLKFGEAPTPEGAFSSCEVAKTREVAGALRRLLAAQRTSRRLVLGVDAAGTVFKRLRLPPMTEGELANAVKWEMVDYFPGGEVAVSFRVLKEDGSGLLVAAVGARTDCVSSLVQVGKWASGRLLAIDVDCVAAYRALRWAGSISGEACLLVHPKKDWVSVAAFDSTGVPVFARHFRVTNWKSVEFGEIAEEVVRSLDYYSSMAKDLGPISGITVLLTRTESHQLVSELQQALPWLPVREGYLESGAVPPEYVVALGLALWEKDR